MSDTTARLMLGARGGQVTLLDEHLDLHGHLPETDPARLLESVERSGLRGRGGAGFPLARKLLGVRGVRGKPIVVANGTEGEPASRKDHFLLRGTPHLVLEGAQLAAQLVGAREAILCFANTAGEARRSVDVALRERDRLGRAPVALRTWETPDRYLAGEETALVRHINDGVVKPTLTPPRPFERGVAGRPTLVSNVETLAHLALIARHGAEWFRAIGTADDPGSRLVTLSGAVAAPGIFEIAPGTSLAELIAAAGGATAEPGAVLVGGYFGTWLAEGAAATVTIEAASLARHGASLGAGAIVVLPAECCGLIETSRIVTYLAAESAGQCGPCVHGLDAIAGSLARVASGRGDGNERGRLIRWSSQVRGRGACRHPDGAVRLVQSALTVFADELELHETGRCRAPGAPHVMPIPAPEASAA